MQNAWNVIWKDAEGRKFLRKFEGESPRESGAIQFGKKLQERGFKPDIISRRKAFGPPISKRRAPELGMLWCPYCLKWRHFREFSVKKDGLRGPSLFRCPICYISIKDFYVKRFNPDMVIKLEVRSKPRLPSEKAIRKVAVMGGRRGKK